MASSTGEKPPRLLFVVYSEGGHLNPMIGVLQRLTRTPAQVQVVSCWSDVGPTLLRAGVTYPAQHAPVATVGGSSSSDGHEFVKFMQTPRRAARWFDMTFVKRSATLRPLVEQAIADFAPDVVCCDAYAYSGAIAAARAGVPWCVLDVTLHDLTPDEWRADVHSNYREMHAGVQPALARLFGSLPGSAPLRWANLRSPWLTVIFASEALVPPELSGDEDSFVVGPALYSLGPDERSTFDFGRLQPDRPLVYAAFGSMMSPGPGVMMALASALEPHEAQLAVGGKSVAGVSLPPHVIAVDWAPQLEMLARADLFVTHGGTGSVMQCLAAGKPMLCIPLLFDQPVAARLLERQGLGRTVQLQQATRENLRAALLALLDPGAPERANAARWAKMGSSDGTERAVELVLELARSRTPLRASRGSNGRGEGTISGAVPTSS